MPTELIASRPGVVAFRDCTLPVLGPHGIRVRSLYGSPKHGTEMAQFEGYGAARGGFDPAYRVWMPDEPGLDYPVSFDYPVLLGNTCVGEIVEIGSNVTRFDVGDHVFRLSPLRTEHIWPDDERTRLLPAVVSWKAALALDPAFFALDAVRDGQVRVGDSVAVFGMGAIGTMAVQFAKRSGAYPVIAVDPLELRREVALEVGADIALDPVACDVGREIKAATEKRGADACIEYSGTVDGMAHALRGVAYGGIVVSGAWPAAYPAGLDFGAEAHMNRARIVFARSCSDPNPDHPRWNQQRVWDAAWRMLVAGEVTGDPIVQPTVPFDDLLTWYPRISSDPGSMVKLGVKFATE